MKALATVFLILALIFAISCTREVLRQDEIDPWLKAMSGDKAPEVNITGKWHDPEGTYLGWGEGHLRQEGKNVNGIIGKYNIRGVVSGKTVYLVFLEGGAVQYTARLEMAHDLLKGNYFKAADKEQAKGYPTSLVRATEPTKR